MARLNADRGERLVSFVGLGLMLLVILAVLYLMIPRRAMFEDSALLSHPDALSLAYLKAVLKSDPSRNEVRLALANQLLRSGRYQEAKEILAPLPAASPELAFSKLLLETEIALRTLHANGGTESGDAVRRLLTERLDRFPVDEVPTDELQKLLEMGESLGAGPGFMASASRRLAERDPGRAAHWWAEAGRWALASGNPAEASHDYLQAAKAAQSEEEALRLTNQAIRAALMAAHPEKAYELVKSSLERWPNDDELLRKGVKLALAVSHHWQAEIWNHRYLEKHPSDISAWRDRRDIELALHKLDAAAEAAQRLASSGKATLKDEILLARILEWSGRPSHALEIWKRVAIRTGKEKPLAEVARLAKSTLHLEDERDALEELRSRRLLSETETWRLAQVLEMLGEPERADETLADYLTRHPTRKRFWEKRLALATDRGDPEAALNILEQMTRPFGRSDDLIRRKARLLWSLYREEEAWKAMKSLQAPLHTDNLQDLELYGELAWRAGDRKRAFALYRTIYRRYRDGSLSLPKGSGAPSPLLETTIRRLVLLAERQGDLELAGKLALQGWRTLHDSDLLLHTMTIGVKRREWPLVNRLAEEALSHSELRPLAKKLLVMVADAKRQQGRTDEAERFYRKALQLDPAFAEARLGLLWLYFDGQRRRLLRIALEEWRADATKDRRYWGAYAAGWELLDQPNAAIAWYRRQIARTPRDPLWLFNFADVLEKAGRNADAWRIRHFALFIVQPDFVARLRQPKALSETVRKTIQAISRLAGRPILSKEVARAGFDEKLNALFLVSWELSRENEERIRYWLARKQVRRLQLPTWQKMSLALLENDRSQIERLLDSGRLAPLDRIRGEERLGRYNLALAHALPFLRPETSTDVRWAATQWAAELYRRLPTNFDLSTGWEEIGRLQLRRQLLGGRLSRRDLSLGLAFVDERLDMPTSVYDLAGIDREQRLDGSAEWFDSANRLNGGLGVRRRNDRNLLHTTLAWRHQLSRRNAFQVSLEFNGLSDATQIARADTAIDRLKFDWESNFTPRTAMQLNFERHRLKSRRGSHIADGNLVEFSLHDKQMLGTNELQLRLQGAWLRNSLVDTIPPEMAARMAPASTVEEIVTPEYGALGVGLAIARGEPMSRAPVVGGLRYHLDTWVGWQWPTSEPAVSFSASIGSRLFGSDEIALSYYYSNALNFAPDQDSQGIQLQYRYFFGR